MSKQSPLENDQEASSLLEHVLKELSGGYRHSPKIPLQARHDLIKRVGKAYGLLSASLPEYSIKTYIGSVERVIARAYRSYIGTKNQSEFDTRYVELPDYEVPVAFKT